MRRLTAEDIQALIRLMGDSDARTAAFARDKLLEAAVEDVLPHLKEAVSDADPLVRGRARLFLEELRLADLNQRWERLAGQSDSVLDLETGAFLVAKYRYPEVDMEPYRRWLDQQADAIAVHFDPALSMYRTIGLVNMQLFEKAGLQGDDVRYYDPDNSCLNRVIDRKRGIPITLSIIYILVGRRLGLPLDGVGLPGHFLVRYSGQEESVFIDPFHRGRLLTREDCIRHVRAMGYPFREHFLKPLKARAILVRMLGNLHRIYVETEQPVQAEHIKGFQDILTQKG